MNVLVALINMTCNFQVSLRDERLWYVIYITLKIKSRCHANILEILPLSGVLHEADSSTDYVYTMYDRITGK